MRGGPTPGYGQTPDPIGCELFRVSYRSARGETFSKLFRQQTAAQRFAQRVLDNGGEPRVHRASVATWREDRSSAPRPSPQPAAQPW
jgi:hypothetical protein